MPKALELAGQRFGNLTAVKRLSKGKYGFNWECRCDCGETYEVLARSLKSGNTFRCAKCAKAAIGDGNRKHGMSDTKIYRIWASMIGRCENPDNARFSDYGGRGVTVCERWHTFENFYADMGERPAGMSIDRVENDKGYEPENCRWATIVEQNNNRRSNVIIEVDGQARTLTAWARHLGISRRRFYTMKDGVTAESIIAKKLLEISTC